MSKFLIWGNNLFSKSQQFKCVTVRIKFIFFKTTKKDFRIFYVLHFPSLESSFYQGRDKSAPIAMLRQAKIYPPRRAAAAAIHDLLVDCSSCNPRAAIHELDIHEGEGSL